MPWSAPALERSLSVRDGRTGELLSLARLLDELAEADVVFLGETHTDETTHRVELAVYEGLQARRDGVVLALEMFQRDVQQHLDDYVAGRIDEPTFLAASRPWSQYRTAYRPLIERAKKTGAPVVASNFPRALTRTVAVSGVSALNELDDAGHAPAELFPNTKEYWRRVDNAIRGHIGMMRRSEDDDRLTSTQTLWDNSMGDACARALDAHPGDLVLHINGGFHSAYWDGTVRQLRLRKPDVIVRTVAISPTAHPAVADIGGVPVADYVVFAEARATDRNEGRWSVYVQRELDYDVHLPSGADEANPVPLLIWLSGDGLTVDNGMALWKDRLGDEVAIAVLAAPYRETLDDLAEGGRWFWPDSFPEDIGALETAVERMWAYVLRHQPIDPGRVCVAGEGTGATVVAAISLLTGRMAARSIALKPSHYARIKDFPLPLPELRGGPLPVKSLRVLVGAEDESWWASELDEYQAIGLPSTLVLATEDAWARELESENELRTALGLEARSPANGERRHIIVPDDSARASFWSRLMALRHTEAAEQPVGVLESVPAIRSSVVIPTSISPLDFVDGEALPRCPGAFGGTTVIVLPKETRADVVTAWLTIEENDPLNEASRFHRLRLAGWEGSDSLAAVLERLQEEGRKNVLIVPASFHTDAATMRTLKRNVRHLEDRMTLQWMPGLGGQLR